METWQERFARANFARSADTAHDLKTPLNIAVLNLELLRMRLRKLRDGEDDEKLMGYSRAIESELRRMGKIFDEFFILSTPPKNDESPEMVDLAGLCSAAAEAGGFEIGPQPRLLIEAHESRIRQALALFFEGASRLFVTEARQVDAGSDESVYTVSVEGQPAAGVELARIFKFYYTDPEGNADLSLSMARLIIETYGGTLNVLENSDNVTLRLTLPVGAQ
ncbi:MAG TPA: histidine kinase dimerization/phospho-acceptor domain-containing protein [Thermoanaerobaculia bacterium]